MTLLFPDRSPKPISVKPKEVVAVKPKEDGKATEAPKKGEKEKVTATVEEEDSSSYVTETDEEGKWLNPNSKGFVLLQVFSQVTQRKTPRKGRRSQ